MMTGCGNLLPTYWLRKFVADLLVELRQLFRNRVRNLILCTWLSRLFDGHLSYDLRNGHETTPYPLSIVIAANKGRTKAFFLLVIVYIIRYLRYYLFPCEF